MTLRNFMLINCMKDAKMLAGEGELDRQITWCAPDPSVDVGDGVMSIPNMLLIYVGRRGEESWMDYLTRIKDSCASALILLTLNYSSLGIPDEAVEFCDRAGLPLILLETGMSVTRFVTNVFPILAMVNKRNDSLEQWLYDICFDENRQLDGFTEFSYCYSNRHDYYCITAFIRGAENYSPIRSEKNLNGMRNLLNNAFSLGQTPVLGFVCTGFVIAFLPFPKNDDDIREKLTSFAKNYKGYGDVKWDMALGVKACSTEEFRESFQTARQTLELIHRLDVHEPISFYKDWHMHMLLLYAPDSELKKFMLRTLEPIMDNQALLDTLTTYLVYGENFKTTSDKMYIHVHTLKYRLTRVSELLKCDLEDTTTRFRLRMAITIYRYLKGKEQKLL